MTSSDKYGLDSHKLIFHPGRVSDWIKGKNIYPIYIEISPVGGCNHRCSFCSVDFMGYKNRRLGTDMLRIRLAEMGKLGIKSIMYAGEGEPFLHPDMAAIAQHTQKSGIDVAFTTNGVLMTRTVSDRVLPVTEWIKISCNAGTPETYSKIHRAPPGDFNMVLKNLTYAVDLRSKKGYSCVLGLQMVLLPTNLKDVKPLAQRARDIGVDYIVIKPYMPHRDNKHNFSINYHRLSHIEEEVAQYQTDTFKVIYRSKAMKKTDEQSKAYNKCLALPFWAYIDAGGNVVGCSVYLGDKELYYGNINESSFRAIWEGPKRKKALQWAANSLDIKKCKVCCRMDEINRYLWQLKRPMPHVNFI